MTHILTLLLATALAQSGGSHAKACDVDLSGARTLRLELNLESYEALDRVMVTLPSDPADPRKLLGSVRRRILDRSISPDVTADTISLLNEFKHSWWTHLPAEHRVQRPDYTGTMRWTAYRHREVVAGGLRRRFYFKEAGARHPANNRLTYLQQLTWTEVLRDGVVHPHLKLEVLAQGNVEFLRPADLARLEAAQEDPGFLLPTSPHADSVSLSQPARAGTAAEPSAQ